MIYLTQLCYFSNDGGVGFFPSRSGKYTENINGTLPPYQPVQEEEPQKKQPGKKQGSCS